MKPYKLGNTTYQQITHVKECSYNRLHEIHSHITFALYGHTPGEFIEKMEGLEKAYEERSARDFVIYLHEGKKCMENIHSQYNPDEHIFALLVLTDEEVKDESNKQFVDTNYLKDKIQKFRDEGLNLAHTAEINAFFFMNSRQHFSIGGLRLLRRYTILLQELMHLESEGQSSDATSS